MITTDYLVIGAGAAGIAFCDTLLVEQPNATITLVDKRSTPGGHWNDAYGHVHLHQPSLLYGTESDQLEGNWLWLLLRHQTLFFKHRASKQELLEYYNKWVNKWVQAGNVTFLANSEYDFKASEQNKNVHRIILPNGETTDVRVNQKVVNGVIGECRIPSLCPPEFPIKSCDSVITPNQLYDTHLEGQRQGGWKVLPSFLSSRRTSSAEQQRYVVLGAGKTSMDAVVFLQRSMKVPPEHISWVVPNDVWMLRREGPGLPGSWPTALLEKDLDPHKAAVYLEKDVTAFVRLDQGVEPTKYRFPVVGKDEFALMQKIPKSNIIRRGRVSSITGTTVSFTDGKPIDFAEGTKFVHCTSPGPFNGNTELNLFPSNDLINLWLVYAPPIPISMSTIATLESRRLQGKLDLDFGRRLCAALMLGSLQGEEDQKQAHAEASLLSDDNVLNQLVRGYPVKGDDVTSDAKAQVMVLVTDAIVLALLDRDPLAALKWQKSNRLSTRSIPGQPCGVYETLTTIERKADVVGLTDGERRVVKLLVEKLQVLEGK